jgi:hypothetical protein
MRMLALILAVMVATLPVAPASSQDKANPPPKDQAEESANKIKELQKERIVTLKQLADQTTKRFQSGAVSFEEVWEARLLVLKAELDAAERQSDRVPVYKKIVDMMKEYEVVAIRHVQNAQAPGSSVLKVKARRLEAEIDLERAKAKEAKQAK